jgi:hypothetical protein
MFLFIKDEKTIILIHLDVIFDPEIVPYLVKTIDYLIKKSKENSGNDICAYISSAIRNPDTYKLFLDKLSKNAFGN